MIIVVSGLPRSGTSMIMQMLSAGGIEVLTDGLREADESNPRGYLEFENVKALARDSAWISDAEGKAVKVIAQLLPSLPGGHEYAVLFMHRDLDEVLASQKAMLGRLGRAGAALDDTTLRAVFQKQLDAARSIGDQRDDMRVMDVHHRDVLTDPLAAASAISDFLGLDLDLEASARVVDGRLYRERGS